jgi:hypothetical protein
VLWETDATLRGDILRKRGVDLELLWCHPNCHFLFGPTTLWSHGVLGLPHKAMGSSARRRRFVENRGEGQQSNPACHVSHPNHWRPASYITWRSLECLATHISQMWKPLRIMKSCLWPNILVSSFYAENSHLSITRCETKTSLLFD